MSSGWFDCTEPHRDSSLHVKQQSGRGEGGREGRKHGLVYTVCTCVSCVHEITVKDFVHSCLLNEMNMQAKNAV